jgi:putative PIN family toxin of toxin-antitoxin system
MLRVVLDTSVIASAFRSSRGASRAILELVDDRRLIPLATPALFLQYEAVLKRPHHLMASGFSLGEVDEALIQLADAIEAVEIYYSWRPQLPDPDDEMVFEAAVNGRADALVTHNLRDFRAAAPRFGMRIASPAKILQEALR